MGLWAFFSQSSTNFWNPDATKEMAITAARDAGQTAAALGLPQNQIQTAEASAIGAVYANAKTKNM